MNQITPLETDGYSRFMTASFDDRDVIGIPTGFHSLFSRPTNGGVTMFSDDGSLQEIDIIRGNQKLAPMIKRGSESRPLSGQSNTKEEQFTTLTRSFPLIEEEGGITSDQLNKRVFGQGPYTAIAKIAKAQRLAQTHHKEHQRRAMRTFDKLASQAIRTGKHDAIFDTADPNFQYDFHRKASHTISVPVVWDAGTPKIIEDIDSGCTRVMEDGHLNPDICIMGTDAFSAFSQDSTILSLADNRRAEFIVISRDFPVPPELSFMVSGGFIPQGRLNTYEGYTVWIFTYNHVYTDDSNVIQRYMPKNEVIIGSSLARCDRYVGPSEVMPSNASRDAWIRDTFGFDPSLGIKPANIKNSDLVYNSALFNFDAYASANYKNFTIRTQSGVIFAPVATDGWALLTDMIT